MNDELKARLLGVLNHPLTSEIEVLLHAKSRLGANAVLGNSGSRMYLYCPGSRKDRVLICAHADTVWSQPGHDQIYPVIVEIDGVLRSGYSNVGIGADDRAGIAMALELADLGHSVLITTGEEKGMVAATEIKRDPGLRHFFTEIQNHAFLVQLDRMGSHDFKCYDVGTDEFRSFVADATGYKEPNRLSFTDICTLCDTVCGVNFSVGYYNEHGPKEHLVLAEFENSLAVVRAFLTPELRRFPLTRRQTPRMPRHRWTSSIGAPVGFPHQLLGLFEDDDEDFYADFSPAERDALLRNIQLDTPARAIDDLDTEDHQVATTFDTQDTQDTQDTEEGDA